MQHTLDRSGNGVRCTVCGKSWKQKEDPLSDCPGAPIYAWDPWPAGMLTAKQMKAKRLIPGPLAGVVPYSNAADGSGYLKVYRESEATPKPALTEAQIAATEKRKAAARVSWTCTGCGGQLHTEREHRIRYCFDCQEKAEREYARSSAADEARALLLRDDLVIWDTETSDLSGDFVEIGAVDVRGKVLFEQRLRPSSLIAEGAYRVHGIRDEELATMPTFVEVYDELRRVLHGKTWAIYNVEFDTGMLRRAVSASGPYAAYRPYFRTHPIDAAEECCIMHLYAQFYGEWSNYHKSYKWQPLPDVSIGTPHPAHSAIGDCLRTLDLIYSMANYQGK